VAEAPAPLSRARRIPPAPDRRALAVIGGVNVFIGTLLRIAGSERRIEVNLVDRGAMRFPMLLGRTALEGMFTVDPSSSFRHARPPRRLEGQ